MIFFDSGVSSVFILRMVLQETFVIKDSFYYDPVTQDQTSNYFLNTNANSITYNSDGYYLLQANTTGNELYVDLRNLIDTVKGKKVRFEADLELKGNTIQMAMMGVGMTNPPSFSQDGIYYVEWDIPNDATYVHFRIRKQNAVTGDSIKIKNWILYFIE